MTDIVLDANALRILLNSKYVEKVKEECDHIYISKKWRKVYQGIKELSMGLQIFSFNVKKLWREKKLHEVSGKSSLPSNIYRELKKKKASEDDFEISQIAYDRLKSGGGKVILVSNNHHITQLRSAFERDGIVIEEVNEELKRLKALS